MEASAAKPNLPQRVGRYDVVGRLDSGGMAEILLGRLSGPQGFEHPVVIKRIHPHLARDPSFLSMFLDEASIAASVRHPNVVNVHELGQHDEDLFLVMEYLEGEPVASLSRRAAARNLQLPPEISAYVVAEACAGLHAAHELKDASGEPRNVVHRDVSPQNVFITYAGLVKVLDFGIAKAADRTTKTEVGLMKGKMAYMSPEHCRGERLDRRADVFALGIVLYEMLTGRHLFKAPTQAATLRGVLLGPIVPPSELAIDVPPALEAVCLKALQRSRRSRYQSAADMRRDLLKVVHSSAADTMPEERLAELMHRLFTDRIEQKREMVARVEGGQPIADVPGPVADPEMELPSVVGSMRDTGTVETTGVKRRGAVVSLIPTWVLAIAIAAGIGLGILGWRLLTGGEPEPALADVDDVASPPPIAAREVEIRIDSAPSGALVSFDGEERGRTPLTVSVLRTLEPVELELVLDGHETLRERVVPDVNQRLQLSLRAEEPAETPVERAEIATPEPTPPRPRTRARTRTRTMAPATMMASGFQRWD